MSKLENLVKFSRDEDGYVAVRASSECQPVDDFLEDLGRNPEFLNDVLAQVRAPDPEPWMIGGNSCHITLTPESVLIEHDFLDESVTLPRLEFLKLLENLTHEVTTARAERQAMKAQQETGSHEEPSTQ